MKYNSVFTVHMYFSVDPNYLDVFSQHTKYQHIQKEWKHLTYKKKWKQKEAG